MTNYFGELLVLIVGIIVGTFSIGTIVKLVFSELTKYRNDAMKPFESSLNNMINTMTEGFSVMFKDINKLNKMNEEKDETIDWNEELKG